MNQCYHTEPALDAEAADWVVRLEDSDSDVADATLQAQFFAWLQQSPQHLKAFMEATEAFRHLDQLDSQRRIDVRELLANRSADVIPLREGMESTALANAPPAWQAPTAAEMPRLRARVARWTGIAAGAAMISVGALMATTGWHPFGAPTYTTAIGEQRSFKLDDGSTLYLNTNSRAEVRFSERAREIRLLAGEALFAVEHDATRPFLVSTDSATVRAIGTQFNVYRDKAATRVTVIEGVVDVAGSGADISVGSGRLPAANAPEASSRAVGHSLSARLVSRPAIRITTGEEARVADGVVTKRTLPDVDGAVAWRERQLVFRNAPLSQVAAEFNRYNKMQIQLEDEAVRQKQLTGIFSADHPQSVILYLSRDESLVVQPKSDAWVIRGR